MAGKVEKQVEDVVERVIKGTDYELVEVEYQKEGADWYLRVYIDHPEGIVLDQCEKLSREISTILDKEDPIPNSYILEVSSPGIERPLKKDEDFHRFAGYRVSASTYTPIEGKKSFQGTLLGLEANVVAIQDGGDKWMIPREKISMIHLSVDL
ncbi:ribosome maturation factor RimP [Metallumcola ferriviriculae]|uniref:Ribosome maturation factor RimP n=1 Tax=Metallumcola ferriviriculae TaxID=3039180 RepID=A0AAU0UPV5_9FIRM|nr:ribosome maturation factor RimP [Desulfitibacteraceae bacterium MK1]